MVMKCDSEAHRKLLEAAQEAGWPMSRGKRHIKVFPPSGRALVVSTTKVGRRSELNTRSQFRKAGLEV